MFKTKLQRGNEFSFVSEVEGAIIYGTSTKFGYLLPSNLATDRSRKKVFTSEQVFVVVNSYDIQGKWQIKAVERGKEKGDYYHFSQKLNDTDSNDFLEVVLKV